MKKFPKKIFLILASVCLGLGLLVGAAGFALADFNLNRLNGQAYEPFDQSFSVPANLQVQTDDVDLHVTAGGGDRLEIKGEGCKIQTEKRDDGLLLVRQEREKREWYEVLQLGGWQKAVIEIILPKSFSGQLEVESGSGALTIQEIPSLAGLSVRHADGILRLSNLYMAGDCTLENHSGGVELDNLSARTLSIRRDDGRLLAGGIQVTGRVYAKSGDGATNFSDVKAENMELDVRDGHLQLTDLDLKGNLTAHAGDGKITMERITAGGEVETDARDVTAAYTDVQAAGGRVNMQDGRLLMTNASMEGAMTIVKRDGDVKLEASTAGLLDIQIQDGSVSGTLLGSRMDYKAGVEIRDGHSNLQTSHTGDKEIRIRMRDGDVEIGFAD